MSGPFLCPRQGATPQGFKSPRSCLFGKRAEPFENQAQCPELSLGRRNQPDREVWAAAKVSLKSQGSSSPAAASGWVQLQAGFRILRVRPAPRFHPVKLGEARHYLLGLVGIGSRDIDKIASRVDVALVGPGGCPLRSIQGNPSDIWSGAGNPTSRSAAK